MIVILFANMLVAITKIALGYLVRSASIASDGLHSISDGFSNVVGLVGISWAAKPVDCEHPYGHQKFEVLASLCISGMLFLMFGKIVVDGIDKLIHPATPVITIESLLLLIATLIINVFVCVYEYHQGKVLYSQILVSDSMHTKSDIFVSAGVLITLLGIRAGLPAMLDPIVSFVVAGAILHAAYEIFLENSGILVDRVMIEEAIVRALVMQFEEVVDVHHIRSRGSKQDMHIDMHILIQPDLNVEQSHSLTHAIEQHLQSALHTKVQLIAHVEPFYELEKHID